MVARLCGLCYTLVMKRGSKHSVETKLKMSKRRLGKWIGKKNHKWKGNKVGYIALHDWIKRYYGKASKCESEDCAYKNPRLYHWANISGKYKRDISDWKQLCPSCHKKMDWRPSKFCRNGHLLKRVGIFIDNRGSRICKACKRLNAQIDYARHKDAIIERVNRWRRSRVSVKA